MSSGCRCLVASLSSSISRNLNIYSLINSLMARYRGPRGLVALTQVVTSFTAHEDTGACVALGRERDRLQDVFIECVVAVGGGRGTNSY